MPKHTMTATTVSVRKIRSEAADRLPVNNLDGSGLSLLGLFYGFVAAKLEAGSGWVDLRAEQIVTPTELMPSGRTVLMRHESGNYGSAGRIRNRVNGGETYAFGRDEAPTIPRWSCFVVPEVGDFAVCMDHRIATAALPKLFWAEFRRTVRRHHKLLVDVSTATDGPAWNAFLDDAEKLRRVVYVQIPDDRADGQSFEAAVNIRKYEAITDPEAQSAGLRLLRALRNRGNRRERARADRMVMLPADFGEPSVVSVTVDARGETRTLDVAADEYPAFLYSLSTRGREPSEDIFLSDARDVARHLLEDQLNCRLGPASWRDAPWDDDQLDQRLVGATDDDDVDPDRAVV